MANAITYALPAIGGLVLGAVAGWFARGTTAATSATVVAPTVSASTQPTGSLPPDVAKKLATDYVEQATTKGTDQCRWNAVERGAGNTWKYNAKNDDAAKCVAALEKAGLAKKGDCSSPIPGSTDCWYRSIVATGEASFSTTGVVGLGFPCGDMKFLDITSITTEGNKATLKYEREFTPNAAVMASVSACQIESPAPGKQTRERKASRDDAGNWSIIN